MFRGGGSGERKSRGQNKELAPSFMEGSIDRVAIIDEELFVTGSDNGSLSLWSMHKKKPVFTLSLAHGLDPALTPEEAYAEQEPSSKVPSPPQPRWITALATVPYSDLILSGSWDGCIKAWKVSEDKRRIEFVGIVGKREKFETSKDVKMGDKSDVEDKVTEDEQIIKGVVNDIKLFERGERGQDGLCILAAVGTEHRLGRWKKVPGKNGAVVFEVKRLS